MTLEKTAVVAGWQDRFADAMMGSLATPTVMLDHGEGCYVVDTEGKRYLDFLAGIAVNSLGHAHPALVEAISSQAARIIHVSNYFASAPQLELAERLLDISGAGESGRVYFANSGTEAMEAAVKLARLHRDGPAGPDTRRRIIALNTGFHGRTMGALALTGKPALQDPFRPLLAGVEHIDATLQALEAAVDDTVAAVVVEPIKGEAGVVDLPEGFLQSARELTTRHGALLILDEIQTGVGRTGTWFAFQQHGIVPDAVALAKGIAGGVPMGALITFGSASDLFQPGSHGTTFGGNPLATAAANAVIDVIERSGLVENAARRGEQIREGIRSLGSPLVTELRGRGLLIGVGLAEPIAARVTVRALDLGLIVNAPTDSTIRLAPPLIVGDEEIRLFLDLFRTALTESA